MYYFLLLYTMENENLLPGTPEDLAKETGCPVDEIERMAEDMGFDFAE